MENLVLEAVFFFHFAAMRIGLWGNDNEFCAERANVIDYFVQSIQLCDTVRSPETAEKTNDERTFFDELAKGNKVTLGIDEVEIGHGLARVDGSIC